jgi:1-deoxy-D-xylulose 5-phosphate reductoisomerase
MNAANEVAVAAFLEERLPFDKIPKVIGQAMDHTGKSGKACFGRYPGGG